MLCQPLLLKTPAGTQMPKMGHTQTVPPITGLGVILSGLHLVYVLDQMSAGALSGIWTRESSPGGQVLLKGEESVQGYAKPITNSGKRGIGVTYMFPHFCTSLHIYTVLRGRFNVSLVRVCMCVGGGGVSCSLSYCTALFDGHKLFRSLLFLIVLYV